MSHSETSLTKFRQRVWRACVAAFLAFVPVSASAVTANGDNASTPEEQAVVIDALANDTADGNPPLSLISATDPANGSVVINGDDTITYTPDPDYSGSDSFDYTIEDGLGTLATATATITVSPVNDPPSFTTAGDQSVDEDTGSHVVPGWASAVAGPPDEAGQTFTYNVGAPSDPSLFSVAPAVDGVTGDLSFDVAPDRSGSATVTLSVSDNGGGSDTSADQTFTITIGDVNDPPSFVSGGDVSVDEDSSYSASWASAIAPGPADEGSQTVSFNAVADDPTLFSAGPAIDSTGVLTFTPTGDAVGSTTVTVSAVDDGGTANGGIDGSPDQTFQITIEEVNDPPSFSVGMDPVVVGEDDGPVSIPGWAASLDVGSPNETGQTLTFNVVSVSPPELFATQPAVDGSGNLTFATAQDANGTATVTLNVSDSGGTANGGVDTSTDQTFDIQITPENDEPVATNPIGSITWPEDGPDILVDLDTVFEDVDGDALMYDITRNDDGSLFDVAEIVGSQLRLDLAFDVEGSTIIEITATDSGSPALTGSDTFDVIISGVNDFPAPQPDSVTIGEDSGPVLITVLPGDYLAEQPSSIKTAGVDDGSESTPVIVLDENGDPIGGPNGTVSIVVDQIRYTPRENFFGEDFFHYTIVDANGDTGCTPPDEPGPECWARVTVTVTPVNDVPTGPAQQSYSMLENGILEVEEVEGLLFGSYDVEGAVVDPDTGEPVGTSLSIVPVSFPPASVATVDLNVADGSFTFTPALNVTGEITFTYSINDGSGSSDVYTARVVVYPAPEPPEPPPAGEVAVPFNLSNVPLEQSTSVAPNVIVMMDDSGSMDWNMSVRGADENGGFVIDNDEIATNGETSTSYYYLWDLDNNIFSTGTANGRILPTQDEMEQWGYEDNHYGLWRARNSSYNRLYYNPEVQYTPWVGQDDENDEYENADPERIRLNPRDPSNDFNMLDPHDYHSDRIPRWRTNGGTDDRTVDDLYIPHYYTTTAEPPLAWDDPHTLVEISDGAGPLAGGEFPGGPGREDCAAGDGDSTDCTYEQEIQNFANWFQYYRTREYASKNALGKVISEVQDIRIGYETINDNRSEPVRDMNDLYTEGNKKSLMDDIYRTNSSGSTPLRRALDRAGDIFRGEHGDDPLLPEPEGFCQQNFTLLFSDGYWNGSDPSQDNEDGDDSSDFDGGRYEDDEQETLADVAMYFYERDLRSDMDDLVPVSQRDRIGVPDGVFDSGANARMHQHMKTYTVAFGVVGDVDPADIPVDPTEAFDWPDPEDSPQGKIDDMLHAAVNGRGQFLSAVNPQELQTALEAAFLEFTQAASSTSAAAFNSTSLQEGTLLYRGFYDLRDFTGELTATLVNPDGTLAADPEWRASEQLNPGNKAPDARVLVTFDPDAWEGIPFRTADLTADQQLVLNDTELDYMRGERDQEQPDGGLRRRPSSGGLLGDIVNSSPVFVGDPRGLNRDQAPYPEDDLYSEFVESRAGRQEMVYVGANDGIMHGFNAATGEERFGYIPNKIIDDGQNYHNDLDEFTSPFYQHKYFVDLSPRISDAYVKGSAAAGSRSWNTILMGGLGVGGKGFFALNVTNPSDYATETNARDVVLWEFTDEDDTSPSTALDPFGAPVKDLGYSLSLPTVAMSNVPNGDGNEWVAIFGNGPNSTAGIAKLFVLFMDDGLNGWGPGDFVKLDTGRGVPVAPEQLAGYPNGLGTPALVDTDLNGTVDWVYAGDRLGNLYRFDLCDRDPDTEECSSNAADWKVTRLFTATYDEGAVDRLQPILTQPLVVKHPQEDGFLVIFGTGSYVTKEDADSEEIQSIYAIWDRGEDNPATALDDSKETRLVEQTLTNVVDDSVSPAMTRRALTRNVVEYRPDDEDEEGIYGWYIDLDMPRATSTLSGAANPDVSGRAPPDPQFPGEKAIRRLVLRNGAVVTTTVLPSLDEFSCYGTRPGAILLLDAVTGGDVRRPVIDFNNDGEIDEGDLVNVGGEQVAAGLLFNQSDLDGALVDLSTLGGEGDTDWLFACGGNDCVPFEIEPPDESRTGRLSWRELDQSN